MNKQFIPYDSKLLKGIGEILKPFGFSCGEYDFLFTKRNFELSQTISFGQSAEFSASARYSPRFTIVCDAVESIKDQVFNANDVGILNSTLIQGLAPIASYYNNDTYSDFSQYVMYPDDKNVFQIKVDFTNFLEILGHNFIKDTSSLKGVSTYLNSQILEIDMDKLTTEENTKLIRSKGSNWAVNGIIAARLTEDNLQELIKRYKKIFFPDHIQAYLNRLLDHLKIENGH